MSIFDKVSELKDKFMLFFRTKKKLQALENYAQCVSFAQQDYITLIKRCVYDSQAGEAEDVYLSHVLDRCQINYLHWSHRTQALKKEMVDLRRKQYKPQAVQGFLFDINKTASTKSVPSEMIMASVQRSQGIRI